MLYVVATFCSFRGVLLRTRSYLLDAECCMLEYRLVTVVYLNRLCDVCFRGG